MPKLLIDNVIILSDDSIAPIANNDSDTDGSIDAPVVEIGETIVLLQS